MRTLGIFSTSLAIAVLVGCGPATTDNNSGADAGSSDDAGSLFDGGGDPRFDSDSGTGDDGGSPSGDGGSSTCVATDPDDPADDDGVDANCDGADGRADRDVYVNPTSGSDTNAGTAAAPFATIAKAVAVAAARIDATIFLATGSYDLDELKVSGKVRIFGGYGAKFVGKPNRDLTTVHVGAQGLLLTGTGGDAKLAHLTIFGDSPTSVDQPTAHALRSKIDLLTLDDVVVRAGDGFAGRDGDPGVPGDVGHAGCNASKGVTSPSPAGCNALTVCDGVVQPAFTGGAATGLTNAEGKKPGAVTVTSWCSSPPCMPEVGSNGFSGADGKDAAKTPVLADGLVRWTAATDGLGNGTAGYGGPGGAGYYSWEAGHGGSGGCPGKGGAAGTSGGGAIAILVLSGELKVTRSSVMTGFGGDGGAGGEGGAGGLGGSGGIPLDTTIDVSQCAPKPPPPPGTSAAPTPAGCARFGGWAGTGGRGGHGGGGAGGWTIGIATTGAAMATIDEATSFTLGKPGVGGSGNGGGYAPSGEKKSTYAIK